jgi:ParB family chromosome partitioning protein
MAKRGGLGKGLSALIPGENPVPEVGLVNVSVNQIVPNPRQPREQIDDSSLFELAESIREHGILQPLVITIDPGSDRYTLVAGERRLRAARLAGLEKVPAVIRQVNEQERLELALVENIQRSDLTALETAEAYQLLHDEFGLRHEDIADRVGKSRESVSNMLRLLNLADEARQALRDGLISAGHAIALLGLANPIAQNSVLKTILSQKLTVRQTEELVKKLKGERVKPRAKAAQPSELHEIEDRLRGFLGTRVAVRHGKKGGSLVIYYYSDEELNTLIAQIIRES